jgi:hypothetical protein
MTVDPDRLRGQIGGDDGDEEAALIAAVPTVYAQPPSDFAMEPDKSMANAHESFMKGD